MIKRKAKYYMNNYSKHYKEISPLDTVNNIKQFFADRGFHCVEEILRQEQSTTWSLALRLYYKDHSIIKTYGKGVSKEFALASGYAEMYERFCNGMHYLCNPFLCNEKIKANQKKYGYSLFKTEKEVSFEEGLGGEDSLMYKFFNSFDEETNYMIKDCFISMYDNKFFGVPYINLTNPKEIKYLDPRFVQRYQGSSGMAAGNTLVEALNQGLSEIFEHYVVSHFYTNIDKDYYFVNINSITDEKLIKIIKAIESYGNKYYIIDMSRTFNVPVVMGILINYKNGTISANFGAFPVFEIAVERILTEMYQNCFSYDDRKYSVIMPYKTLDKDEVVLMGGSCITNLNTFPENILLNKKYTNTINKDIFLSYEDKSYSNEEILEWNKKIAKSIGAGIYYADMSLSNKIIAIDIYLDKLGGFWYSFLDKCKTLKTLKESIILTKNKCKNIQNYLDTGAGVYNIIKDSLTFTELIEDSLTDRFLGLLSQGDLLVSYNNIDVQTIPNEIFVKDLFEDPTDYLLTNGQFAVDITVSPYYKKFKKYLNLYSYIKSRKYTNDEIINILKEYGYEYTDEDFENALNRKYLVKKCILEPMRENFNSEDFKTMIENY